MFWHSRVGCSLPFLINVVIGLMIHQQVLPWQGENKKNAELFRIQRFCGGEDATRTHNALRHTTFPMWLLTIRIPLQAMDIIISHVFQKCKCFFKKNFILFSFRQYCAKYLHIYILKLYSRLYLFHSIVWLTYILCKIRRKQGAFSSRVCYNKVNISRILAGPLSAALRFSCSTLKGGAHIE